MGKKREKELSGDELRCLEKYEKEWNKEVSYYCSCCSWLTLPRLRLLLEDFAPLRQLIRDIAGTAPRQEELQALADPAVQEALAQAQAEAAALRQQLVDIEARVDRLQEEHRELHSALEQERKRRQQAEEDLRACQDAQKRMEKELASSRKAYEGLHRDYVAQEKELAALRARPALGEAGEALALLQKAPELARRLGLEDLDEGVDAALRVVAVLAQKDRLFALWEALRETVNAQKRPATAEERRLLELSLAWHNLAWKNLAYQLEKPAANKPFDFDRQQRAQFTSTGETVARVLLPGLLDGKGKPERKAVVETR